MITAAARCDPVFFTRRRLVATYNCFALIFVVLIVRLPQDKQQ